MSINSEIIGKSYLSPTLLNIFNPSTPIPWKAYGDVRGLNAPPLNIVAPDSLMVLAIISTCSYDSTLQGPAITTTLLPPILTPFTSIIVSSLLILRFTFLNGSWIRITLSTHLYAYKLLISNAAVSPTTP